MALSKEGRASVEAMRKAWVEKWPKAVRENLQAETLAAAEDIAAMQRRLAPVSEDKDPGQLRDSITVRAIDEQGRVGAVITAGGRNAPHGRWVEFGTRKMRAQPFFWPSVRALRAATKRRISAAFRRATKKGGLKGPIE